MITIKCSLLILCACVSRYRWAFVPEVDMSRYSGPENGLLEEEQECKPHVVKVLEALHQRYGVRERKHHYRAR